jgi:hypothetical protein
MGLICLETEKRLVCEEHWRSWLGAGACVMKLDIMVD